MYILPQDTLQTPVTTQPVIPVETLDHDDDDIDAMPMVAKEILDQRYFRNKQVYILYVLCCFAPTIVDTSG
jgi:hypothetical protein